MKGIRIGNKESKYPIIQGGMGVGVSMHNLAGNVSKEGGIGIISTADIGYLEEDFIKNPMSANLRAIGKEIKKGKGNCWRRQNNWCKCNGSLKELCGNCKRMRKTENRFNYIRCRNTKGTARICKRKQYKNCSNCIFS